MLFKNSVFPIIDINSSRAQRIGNAKIDRVVYTPRFLMGV